MPFLTMQDVRDLNDILGIVYVCGDDAEITHKVQGKRITSIQWTIRRLKQLKKIATA